MKKALSFILAAILSVSVLAGCSTTGADASSAPVDSAASSSEAPKATVITWLHHIQEEAGVAYMQQSTKAFTDANPNVTFELTAVPQDNYATMLKSKLAAGDAPDMFDVDLEQNIGFVESGYVYDFSGQPWLNNFVTAPPAGPDGKIYAIPSSTTFFGVFYNKDAFTKAGISATPTTWDEFTAVCDKLKVAGITPVASGYKDLWTMQCSFHAGKMTSIAPTYENWTAELEARTVTWANNNKADMVKILDQQAYIYDNSQKDPFGTTWDTAQNLVVTGEAAMIINGSWVPGNLEIKDPNINVGMFPLPVSNVATENVFSINGSAKDPANAYYGMGQCVYAKTPNIDAILKYLEFKSSVEDGNLYQNTVKQLSNVKGCSAEFDKAYEEWVTAQDKGLVADIGAFRRDYSGEFDTVYCNVMTEYLMSTKRDIQAALTKLDKEFDRVAASNN